MSPVLPLRPRLLAAALAAAALAACTTVPQEQRPPLEATRMLDLELMPPVYELITPKPLEKQALGLHPSIRTIDALAARVPELAEPQQLYQTGQASWYGDRFHGRLTANGERYNMYGITAAHRTLPFGTLVCVRSLQTGKEVQVRINDRGPYSGQRIIDLSRGAAEELGMLSQGLKNVALWIPGKNGPQCGQDERVALHGKGLPPPENPPRKANGSSHGNGSSKNSAKASASKTSVKTNAKATSKPTQKATPKATQKASTKANTKTGTNTQTAKTAKPT